MKRKLQDPKFAENRQAYIKKMDRQIEGVEIEVETLEDTARQRKAELNVDVRTELETMRRTIEETRERLEELIQGQQNWPEGSKEVSGVYRNLKNSVESTESKVKPK